MLTSSKGKRKAFNILVKGLILLAIDAAIRIAMVWFLYELILRTAFPALPEYSYLGWYGIAVCVQSLTQPTNLGLDSD